MATSAATKIAARISQKLGRLIDPIDRYDKLALILFCVVTLAALQGRFCFIQLLHCHPLPVPYHAYIPRSSLPSWVIHPLGNGDKSIPPPYATEPA